MSNTFPPERILMGPGPSTVPARVLSALGAPTLGHLDPDYLAIMDRTRDQLRALFQTENELTMAVSGTGSAGMEACVANLIEPGDEAIVCINGVFGTRSNAPVVSFWIRSLRSVCPPISRRGPVWMLGSTQWKPTACPTCIRCVTPLPSKRCGSYRPTCREP